MNWKAPPSENSNFYSEQVYSAVYKKLLWVVATLVLCPCIAWAQISVRDGVYTAAQAVRGENAFEMHCSVCHEGNEPDGPLLTGADFVDRWREDKLASLFRHIKTEMPGNEPGSLPENIYVDITAFLLGANGYPAGSSELTASATNGIQFVGKDGPKPLPSSAGVLVVGCLTAGPNGSWILARGTDPVRTRALDETTPEELKESAGKPLGTLSFRLQNAPATAAAFVGHRIQVKGVLIRQTNNDRMNVTSLETAGSDCMP